MTARDPDLQAAVDRAVTRIATAMRPIASIDPTTLARQVVEDLYGGPDHWRPWPGRDRIPDPGRKDPTTAQRGATYARDLLAKRTKGDTDDAR